ncbi:sodium/calcium exchanger 3-like isoform X2 [Apostichopus japonicus]|uniref:sodium/calcium exchanger 3-like isoform X2 n=1 Tax=Stichopus japonicus TaxID=307972 RepID=UPI003AB70DAA
MTTDSEEFSFIYFQNFSNGHVAEYYNNRTDRCTSWILLPAENLWPRWIRGVLYLTAMFYIFMGIAIISDVFMCSIEVITSKSRTVYKWDPEKKETVKKEVLVWNETIANLTLMALGSSAPEILLSVVEALQNLSSNKTEDSLGTFTIIGSAAFNLLIITAVCITTVKSYEIKKVKEFGVFMLTSIWSIFAYLWVYAVVLGWWSPGEVETWEAWVTLAFFPLLVITAYCQDNGWWVKLWWRFSKGRPTISSEPSSNEQANGSHMNVRVVNGIGRRHSILHGPSPQLVTLEAEKSLSQQNLRRIPEETFTIHPVTEAPSDCPRLQTGHDEEKQQHARARFRHAAVRSMLGGKKKHAFQKSLQTNGTTPRLVALVEKVKSLDENEVPFTEDLKGKFTFASPHYSVLESAGKVEIDVLFHRKALPKLIGAHSSHENGKAYAELSESKLPNKEEESALGGVVEVCFETRDGTAKRETDYNFTQDKLTFLETEWKKTISIPIIKNNTFTSNVEFYVILKIPEGGSQLGDPSVTRVTIIDDDVPGEFSFDKSHYNVDKEKSTVTATVIRSQGSDGTVTLQYTTIDGTAIGGTMIEDGVDYKASSGVLCFKHQETTKTIEVEVSKNKEQAKNFVICLRNPSVGASLGENSAAVVSLTSDELNDRVAYILGDDDEEDESWSDQIRNAMTVGGDFDENGQPIKPAAIDCIMHFVAFFWKVLFSLIPPKKLYGGWPAFVISIIAIGVLILLVQELGYLLACVLYIEPAVAGITIVALGTSVPDMFASRTAAIQDQNADAAIGNITGSNSVNVFLGLGLPWVITVTVRSFTGGKLTLKTTNLDLAVVLFTTFGTVCIFLLILRRKVIGGELGGPKIPKIASGLFLVFLWLIYVLICSLRAYEII